MNLFVITLRAEMRFGLEKNLACLCACVYKFKLREASKRTPFSTPPPSPIDLFARSLFSRCPMRKSSFARPDFVQLVRELLVRRLVPARKISPLFSFLYFHVLPFINIPLTSWQV